MESWISSQPSIETKSRLDVFLVGLYLFIVLPLATLVGNAIHEGGHLLYHWIMGGKPVGIHLTPFGGRAYILSPTDPPLAGFEGLAAELIVGYTLFVLLRRVHVRRLLPDTFLTLLAVILLIGGSFYAVHSVIVKNGDFFRIAQAYHMPALYMYAFACALFLINIGLTEALFKRWFGRFCPDMTGRRRVWAFVVFVLLVQFVAGGLFLFYEPLM